ncbi:hypothetical protein [Streptomyces atratus]|uniref:hypothetical protein n=1 Tax=Streptomyces atratus TaxID=1893 RepID=UPI0033FFF422
MKFALAATGRAKFSHVAHAMDLAERLDGHGVSAFAAEPGPAATDHTAQISIDILPLQLRPYGDQIGQGVSAPWHMRPQLP